MRELEFVERDGSGRLVVADQDGTRFAVPVDDRLRAALRPAPRGLPEGTQSAPISPREVQSMIRAGQSAEEVAESTGWELERVRRFEGPVLAEREHVVGLARAAHVRAQGRTDGSHTLERRVRERLLDRGVPTTEVRWDAARTEHHGPWTVLVTFPAGGRDRRAAWHYDVQDRSIEALDDEARWLSEDEQALPGGLGGHPLLGSSHSEDETADLMAAMRERRLARTKRSGRRTDAGPGSAPTARPPQSASPTPPASPARLEDEVLPFEDLNFDPETMGDPPAAHPRIGEEPDAGEAREPEPSAPEAAEPERGSHRDRRKLRLPRLPAAPGEPEPDQGGHDDEDLAYARTHDPLEVSFDEFFGTDEADDVNELDEPDDVDEHEHTAAPGDDVAELDEQPEPTPTREPATAAGDDAGGSSPSRRKGRTSVPSWDDIMFGGGEPRRRR